VAVLTAVSCAPANLARAAPAPATPAVAKPDEAKPADKPGDKADELKPEEKTSRSAVTIGGRRVDYTAIAGTLVVHPKDAEEEAEAAMAADKPGDKPDKLGPPAAAVSYGAYFATGAATAPPGMFHF